MTMNFSNEFDAKRVDLTLIAAARLAYIKPMAVAEARALGLVPEAGWIGGCGVQDILPRGASPGPVRAQAVVFGKSRSQSLPSLSSTGPL